MRFECANTSNPVLGSLSFSDIQAVVNRALRYPGMRAGAGIPHRTQKWRDYDGFPFEQFHALEDDAHRNSPEWGVRLTYEDTTGDEFDFEELAGRSFTTAYKWGRKITPSMTKFKLRAINIYPVPANLPDDGLAEKVFPKLEVLRDYYEKVESNIQTLRGWLNAGYTMIASCQNRSCSGWPYTAEIPDSRLQDMLKRGVELDEIRSKAICRHCYSCNAILTPQHSLY